MNWLTALQPNTVNTIANAIFEQRNINVEGVIFMIILLWDLTANTFAFVYVMVCYRFSKQFSITV